MINASNGVKCLIQPISGKWNELCALMFKAWSALELVVIEEKESLSDGEKEHPHAACITWSACCMGPGPGWLAELLEPLFEPCVKHGSACEYSRGRKELAIR